MTRPLRQGAPWRRVFAALVATALLASSNPAQTAAASRAFLWKISGKQSVIYLAGSIHVMPPSFYPLSPAFDGAFKESDLLVEEIDLGAASPEVLFGLVARTTLPVGQSLEGVLSATTYAKAKQRLADLGQPIESFTRVKPWMLAVRLEEIEVEKAGYDPSFGLDKHFYDLARAEGKAVQGFETAEFQLSMLDGLPMDEQDRMLADTLKELDTEVDNLNKIGDAWKAGDASALERILMPDLKQDPVMYKKLVVDRNQTWLPKLAALLARQGRAFVVVGAAHLLGSDGLLALLKAKGYTVEQM